MSFDPLAHWSDGSPAPEEHFQEASDALVIKAWLEGQSDQGQWEMTAVCHTITSTLRRINQYQSCEGPSGRAAAAAAAADDDAL